MYTDSFGNKYYKVATHLHSNLSDGKLSPEEIAEVYKKEGYDAIALTDHWRFGEQKEINGLHIISGAEYDNGPGSATMHIVGLFMKHDPEVNKGDSRQKTVNKIKAAGGIAVLAHPAWSMNSIADALEVDGFEATEIYNTVSEEGQSLRAYSDQFVDMCARAGLNYGVLAADDSHYYGGIDNCRGWIMVKADELTDEALAESIKRRDFYASQGPELTVNMDNGKLIIDCSPCDIVCVLSNCAWLPNRCARGKISHFEYTVRPEETWVRVEARSGDKRAWSNIFFM